MANYTHFCCRSGGSNMNAGTLDGSATVPATAAVASYVSGSWDATNNIYTAPSGADLSAVAVGQYLSIFNDGDTSPTSGRFMTGRVTAVNTGTRQITVPATNRVSLGTAIATTAGTISARVGGAWAGPSGASGFPFTFLSTAPSNANGYPVKLNVKNDQTYSITATITGFSGQFRNLEGFTTSYGDGGMFTLDGGTSGAAYTLYAPNTSGGVFHILNMILQNNGATGGGTTTHGLSLTQTGAVHVRRVLFRNLRGPGANVTNGGNHFSECEWYGCNQANAGSCGTVRVTGGVAFLNNCTIHDNPGSNSDGAFVTNTHLAARRTIFDGNGRNGVDASGTAAVMFDECDFYGQGNIGVAFGTAGGTAKNCNFAKNTTSGVDGSTSATAGVVYLLNCGFGQGTLANGANTTNSQNIVEDSSILYTASVTPWQDADNGNFTIVLDAAKRTGRGQFLQLAPGYGGTVAFPDVGAGTSLTKGGSGGIGKNRLGL